MLAGCCCVLRPATAAACCCSYYGGGGEWLRAIYHLIQYPQTGIFINFVAYIDINIKQSKRKHCDNNVASCLLLQVVRQPPEEERRYLPERTAGQTLAMSSILFPLTKVLTCSK
jgi:hypothetical protein